MTGRTSSFVAMALIACAMMGSVGAIASGNCACIEMDCYQDIAIISVGSTAVMGSYRFAGMEQGFPKFQGGMAGNVIIYYAEPAWVIEATNGSKTYYRVESTQGTPPRTGWSRESDGVSPTPTLSGGEACTRGESPIIALFSHRQGVFVDSGTTFTWHNYVIRGQEVAIALDFTNEGTGSLEIASASITTTNCTVEIQEPFPLFIKPGEHPGIRPYATVLAPGTWGFTVTLHNNSVNEPAFAFTFESEAWEPFTAEPAGDAGTILDRGIRPGETAPVDRSVTISAIYDYGETISGAVRITDEGGNPIPDFEARFSLITHNIHSTPITQTPLVESNLVYDPVGQLYRFTLDSGALVGGHPLLLGYYDVRVAFPDGSEFRERIQLK